MAITVSPVHDDFVAEIYDVDLADPAPGQIDEIKAAFWRYAVLVFPGQTLSQDQHVAFAGEFGPMDHTVIKKAVSDQKLRIREDIADVSNLSADNRILEESNRLRRLQLGNRLWHTDSSFKYVPALASLLYAREIPPVGGQTAFADLRAAYDALDDAKRTRLSGLVAEHSLVYSRERLGYTDWQEGERQAVDAVPQAMVRTVPETGRKNLFVASHAGHIVGMDDAEAKPLIDWVLDFATQRQFTHVHRWRVGDLVIWDNRCTLHRGLPFDDLRFRRDVQRATVQDRANSCEQEGLTVPDVHLRAAE
ncbi:MAG: TauD/TfdA family dioxygenase [Alphaproteobacteria bacterium]|nr:TauD/TfdA family dioxygenase [Alphaproteobacteria bacterium]MCB9930609.1 TauD/TfdA family dioxygenase [Alphaproteobacteria bacterium]